MTTTPSDGVQYVLRPDTVHWAVERLVSRRIHPFFPAYLHLRSVAMETGSLTDLHPDWRRGLGPYLEVRDAPQGTPYFRPFWNRQAADKTSYWLNSNLAGSFAPSSLRNEPFHIVEASGSVFSLKPDHAQLARQHLLYGEPVLAVALAAYYYRDFGFVTASGPPPPDALIAILRSDFYFDGDRRDDFSELFDDSTETTPGACFECSIDEQPRQDSNG